MMHRAETSDVGAGADGYRGGVVQALTPDSGQTHSIMDLKGCLAGRRPPPNVSDIQQAVAEAKAYGTNADTDPAISLGLPPIGPGKTHSIMDLKGCLAGRRSGPPLTDEEMEKTIDADIWARYLRSFA